MSWGSGSQITLSRNSAQRTRFARLHMAVSATLQPPFAACALKEEWDDDRIEREMRSDSMRKNRISFRVERDSRKARSCTSANRTLVKPASLSCCANYSR